MPPAKTLENHIKGSDKTVKDEMMTDNADKNCRTISCDPKNENNLRRQREHSRSPTVWTGGAACFPLPHVQEGVPPTSSPHCGRRSTTSPPAECAPVNTDTMKHNGSRSKFMSRSCNNCYTPLVLPAQQSATMKCS